MKTEEAISKKERILGGLWGALIGDALGVPVEFKSREVVQADPVTDMRAFGTHNQPRGTWSDDGAMNLCTIDSLVNQDFNLADMGERFVRWMNDGLWTANGDVFDIGGTTSGALKRIEHGTPADQAGGKSEESNGNGSLMRILPVTLRFARESNQTFAQRIESVSAITHGHARSRMACVFYGMFARQLMVGRDLQSALNSTRAEFSDFYVQEPELSRFNHILKDDFVSLPEDEIVSTGYVLHTLHASLWCLFNAQSFRECVLKAVNLGGDTDTTGCVTGGLAGIFHGVNEISTEWKDALARRGDLDCLFREFADLCTGSNAGSI